MDNSQAFPNSPNPETPEAPRPAWNSSAPDSAPLVAPPAAPNPAAPAEKKPLALIIFIVVVAVLVLATAGFFIYRALSKDSAPAEEPPVSGLAYTTPEGSTDPEADYLAYVEETKSSSSATSEESLQATLSAVSLKLMLNKPDDALALLQAIDSNSLDHSGLYQLYYAYTRVYSEDGLGNPTLYNEYLAQAEAERAIIQSSIEGEE